MTPKRNPTTSAALYAVLLIIALIVAGIGIYLLTADPTRRTAGAALLAAGAASIIAVLLVWPLATTVSALCSTTSKHQEELLQTLADRLQGISVLLNEISEQQLLSDRAKTVAFREKDREALRRAIREEIGRKDYEAARALVRDMETTFGYRQEAAQLMADIDAQQGEVARRQIAEVVAVIDRHCRGEQWSDALREAEQLQLRFPGHEQVTRLPQEIEARRQTFKKQLMESLHAAAARHDVDGGIEVLKQLDPYLTREEAGTLEETVRGLFKERLQGLRVQFAAAVQNHRWAEAVLIGDTIMNEFPNTRIAQEVREKMDALRQRASETPETARV